MNYDQYYRNRDVISLFSGAMGLDIGLGQAGLNVVIGQDFEPSCVDTMRANGHKVLGGDIRQIQPQDLLDMTGLHVGEPFMICSGPPCQPFSTAGKRLGINDPRGSLFMDFIRMIDYIKNRVTGTMNSIHISLILWNGGVCGGQNVTLIAPSSRRGCAAILIEVGRTSHYERLS